MFYTIYKITNLINGKYYIGKHKTKELQDNYMGSGVWLKNAFKKYGKHNFIKEIILICNSEKHMNLAERIMVVCDPEITYNIKIGGNGGFDHINEIHIKKTVITKRKNGWYSTEKNPMYGKKHKEEVKTNHSKRMKGQNNPNYNKKFSEETKRKMSEARKKYWDLKRGD